MILAAFAEEVQRGTQKKKRSDDTAASMPEAEPAASAARDLRENQIESEPNPKRRLLMKSASSTASGSGQQKVAEAEPRMQTGDPLKMEHW